jgi:hypothetical protein
MMTYYLHIIIFDKDMIQLEVFQLKKTFWSIPKTNNDTGLVEIMRISTCVCLFSFHNASNE